MDHNRVNQDRVNLNVNPEVEEEEDDDLPVGRVLHRREVLALFGFSGAALLAACAVPAMTPNAESATAAVIAESPTAQATQAAEVATVEAVNTVTVPSCVVRPEMTEGPYFVDGQMERSDIRESKEGVPLTFVFNVAQIADATCTPLAGATIDIWHCDALGVYSGVSDPGFDTSGESWLRGYQVTDENGRAEFTTIYPGWYSGRAVHIHFKIRTTVTGNETYEFTSQFFFDESLSDQVFTQVPYNQKGQRDTLNSNDGIYGGGGEQMLLNLSETNGGYTTTFDIALDLSDSETGASDAAGQGGPGGGMGSGGERPDGPPPNGTPPTR